jgi:hypothetical protein
MFLFLGGYGRLKNSKTDGGKIRRYYQFKN